jgi:hypothetical protein
MVKNTKGGNKMRSIARKKQNQVKSSEMVYPIGKDQMIVQVLKIGNQYDYWTFDPKLFTSSDENIILWLATKRAGGEISPIGTIFLAQHRECDSDNAKKRIDVIHVYTNEQKNILAKEGYLAFGYPKEEEVENEIVSNEVLVGDDGEDWLNDL